MSVLLRKEIRSLLPAWILTMAATALIAFVQPDRAPVLLFLIAIGCLVLGITSFGSEFAQGTFSLLLVQPIPRHKIWRTKTITLGAALLSVALMAWLAFVCVVLRRGDIRLIRSEDVEMPVIFTVLLLGAAFAGGLLSALATRQMATAFWLALLFPLAASALAIIFTANRSEKTVGISIAAALAVYDIGAFLLARFHFLRVQDVPSAAATIVSLPAWMHFRSKARSATDVSSHHPLRALIAKEFQLHQVSLGFAAVLLALHLTVLLIRRAIYVPVGPQKGLYEILGSWWLLWFVLPLVIAGTAIAEERRQGTLETSLTLPARRSAQWFVKCAVCIFLALLFGAIMPWFLESAAQWIGCPAPVFQSPSPFPDQWHFLRWSVIVVAVMSLLAFYASSLTRGLLQAVGLTVLIASAFAWLLVQLTTPESYYSHGELLVLGDLLPFWLPIFLALLLLLSYINFKQVTITRQLWFKNVLDLLLVTGALDAMFLFAARYTAYF